MTSFTAPVPALPLDLFRVLVNRAAVVQLLDGLPKTAPAALSSTEALASMSVLSVSYSMSDLGW